MLPFRFCWQTARTPAGEGVGFEPTEMSYGCGWIAPLTSGQAKFVVGVAPVAGLCPAEPLHQAPSITHPEFWTLIPAVVDEGCVARIAHQFITDLEWIEPNPVPWGFVVEMKAVVLGTDLHDASFRCQPLAWVRTCFEVCITAVGGLQGLPAESIQQIHQQQLLVLLLVLQPKLHQGSEFRRWFLAEQLRQPSVNVGTPFENFADGWPAQKAPLRTGV